jgi:hypothetical protein
VFHSLQDSAMELNTVVDSGSRGLRLSLFSNLKDTTKTLSTVKSVNETLNIIETIKVVGDKVFDREFA